MFLLRIIVFLILISLIMILAYPLLIVFDISTGGNGFGVCEDLLTCTIPITAGPRLLVTLISAFFFLVSFALCLRSNHGIRLVIIHIIDTLLCTYVSPLAQALLLFFH